MASLFTKGTFVWPPTEDPVSALNETVKREILRSLFGFSSRHKSYVIKDLRGNVVKTLNPGHKYQIVFVVPTNIAITWPHDKNGMEINSNETIEFALAEAGWEGLNAEDFYLTVKPNGGLLFEKKDLKPGEVIYLMHIDG
jgi:hypothetical protein